MFLVDRTVNEAFISSCMTIVTQKLQVWSSRKMSLGIPTHQRKVVDIVALIAMTQHVDSVDLLELVDIVLLQWG